MSKPERSPHITQPQMQIDFGTVSAVRVRTSTGGWFELDIWLDAAANGDVKKIKEYLANGTPVNTPAGSGETALDKALAAKYDLGKAHKGTKDVDEVIAVLRKAKGMTKEELARAARKKTAKP